MGGIVVTSNGFFTDEIRAAFQKIAGDFSTAAIITTASPRKELNRFARKAQADLIELGAKDVSFIDIEFENPSALLGFDVIYINGGNPFLLLHHFRRSGANKILELVNPETTIVGVSAGSLVLGPSIEVVQHFTPEMNTIPLDDLNGLSMIDRIVFPHYDREDLFAHPSGASIEERLKQYERLSGHQIVRLNDYGYGVHNLPINK